MSPVRNPATGFDIRASSFLRHWSFRHSSFSSAWDTDNQLSAKTHDGQALGTADYLYDVLGRRVGKDSGGGSSGKIVTLWWDMREVADYESSGTNPDPIHHYLNLPRHNDRLARTVQSGNNEEIQYYHKNYLDHIYAITDEDGKALEYIRYTAFGLPTYYNQNGIKVATSPTGNQFTWNGKRLDPHLGWHVYHYRHYSPEMGRWPSRDPIGERGGVNLYRFVGNGPLSWWDWLGLFKEAKMGSSIDDVALEALLEARQATIDDVPDHFEFAGAICCKDDRLGFTGPHKGTGRASSQFRNDCPEGWERVGAYHSHPVGAYFNFTDFMPAEIAGLVYFIGTHLIQVEPGGEVVGVGPHWEIDVLKLPRFDNRTESYFELLDGLDQDEEDFFRVHAIELGAFRFVDGNWVSVLEVMNQNEIDELIKRARRRKEDYERLIQRLFP